jgi:hypothetical protein
MTISAVNANGKSESATLEGFTLKVAELQLGKSTREYCIQVGGIGLPLVPWEQRYKTFPVRFLVFSVLSNT